MGLIVATSEYEGGRVEFTPVSTEGVYRYRTAEIMPVPHGMNGLRFKLQVAEHTRSFGQGWRRTICGAATYNTKSEARVDAQYWCREMDADRPVAQGASA